MNKMLLKKKPNHGLLFSYPLYYMIKATVRETTEVDYDYRAPRVYIKKNVTKPGDGYYYVYTDIERGHQEGIKSIILYV